jgi:DNA-binding MarR family transcriptional regulator
MTNGKDIMTVARGFQKSRIILTAAELDFFTHLSEKPDSARRLAEELSLDTRATTRVLDALVVLGLLTKKDGLYRATDEAANLSAKHPETGAV